MLCEIHFIVIFFGVLDTVYHIITWAPLIFTWISYEIFSFEIHASVLFIHVNFMWNSCDTIVILHLWFNSQIWIIQLRQQLIQIPRSQLTALKIQYLIRISEYSNSINICTGYFARQCTSVIMNSENKVNPHFSTLCTHLDIKQVFIIPYYLHILLVSANRHQCQIMSIWQYGWKTKTNMNIIMLTDCYEPFIS